MFCQLCDACGINFFRLDKWTTRDLSSDAGYKEGAKFLKRQNFGHTEVVAQLQHHQQIV
jgi:hypothetical protein